MIHPLGFRASNGGIMAWSINIVSIEERIAVKRNLITLFGVVAIIAGIVVVRSAFEQTIQTESEAKEAAETAKKLEEAEKISDDAKGEEGKANVAEAATKDEADAPAATMDLAAFEPIAWADTTPDTFKVQFDTTVGSFVIESHKEWAPLGHERFYELCKSGFFDNSGFYRVIHGFMVQFGLAADPKMTAQFKEKTLKDEPVRKSNQRGKVTFAKSSRPNSRTTQIFINYADNSRLDADGFTPFAEVIAGMENVDKITDQYGEEPDQRSTTLEGSAYLKQNFPSLDMISKVTLVQAKP